MIRTTKRVRHRNNRKSRKQRQKGGSWGFRSALSSIGLAPEYAKKKADEQAYYTALVDEYETLKLSLGNGDITKGIAKLKKIAKSFLLNSNSQPIELSGTNFYLEKDNITGTDIANLYFTKDGKTEIAENAVAILE